VSELGASRAWLESLGFAVAGEAPWIEALTHGSTGAERDYQRLEFLGDRVLGLAIADWLIETSDEAEGQLTQRLHALVSRQTCAAIAREIGAAEHVRLGKQGRDAGAHESDNVLGDVIEALLGASFLDAGFDATRDVIHRLWREEVEGHAGLTKHPKSALQEWAAGSQHRPPEYTVVNRSGPDHAARFTVRVTVHNVGEVEAEASNKQDAETEAARRFMEQFG
jgi:ribonuclease-3